MSKVSFLNFPGSSSQQGVNCRLLRWSPDNGQAKMIEWVCNARQWSQQQCWGSRRSRAQRAHMPLPAQASEGHWTEKGKVLSLLYRTLKMYDPEVLSSSKASSSKQRTFRIKKNVSASCILILLVWQTTWAYENSSKTLLPGNFRNKSPTTKLQNNIYQKIHKGRELPTSLVGVIFTK